MVVVRQRPASWLFVWLPLLGAGILTAALIVSTVRSRERDAEWVLFFTMRVLQAVCWVVLAVVGLRTRIELHPDELRVVAGFRTRHVPWAEITDVHGDVPRRLDWSTRLVVEAGDRTVQLPTFGTDLAGLRDRLLARVPDRATPPPTPAPAPTPPSTTALDPSRELTGGQ